MQSLYNQFLHVSLDYGTLANGERHEGFYENPSRPQVTKGYGPNPPIKK